MITRQLVRKRQLAALPQFSARFLSTSSAPSENASSSAPAAKPHTIDPRWLTMVKSRVGKCLMFGHQPEQVRDAGNILQQLAKDWRELVAGSEGFLTGEKNRGLFRQSVAWGEMDTMVSSIALFGVLADRRHVNNVMYSRYAETARVNWMRNFPVHLDPAHKNDWPVIVNPEGLGIILKSIRVDYKFPMTWPDKISVYHKLIKDPSLPTSEPSSYELEVMILSEARQRPAARCFEDIVTYDYHLGRKTPLPPFMVEQFKMIWEQQEQAKRTWQQRILDIENQVRELELGSWDRKGKR